MFYQNILTEISPYQVSCGFLGDFAEHRHADIEMSYCLKGGFTALVDKKERHISEGELLLISPMTAHAYSSEEGQENVVLTVIVGVSFLKKFFSYFSNAKHSAYTVQRQEDHEAYVRLFEALEETTALFRGGNEKNDLLVRGSLYRLCAYLIDVITEMGEAPKAGNREMEKVANIERALEMIYYDFAKPLTIEDAALATGYGKSNFCKIFKKITGDTFHNVLNRQRVEAACGFLGGTDLSISQIAAQVGFEETKTFCRVFKSVTAMTPGEYRKSTR
jgi:AraC-like DNA-binding protein